MGGSLFSNKRMSRNEYLILQGEVAQGIFYQLGRKMYVPDTFHNKEDYGDLDVLCEFPLITDEELKDIFGIEDKDIHHNTSVISINLGGRQVDICHFEPEHLQTALAYYRQSDCSNMVGVIYNFAFGMRYTHKGVIYPVKLKQEDCVGEVIISKDTRAAMEFVDLDYNQWKQGFNDKEELFEWIVKSKYFNKDFFAFESLNHQNRTRNRKRATYSSFVEWLQPQKGEADIVFFENNYIPQDKSHHLWRAALHFGGGFLSQANHMIEERRNIMRSRAIFSGKDILEMTGLQGKDLGKVTEGFRNYWDNGVGRWCGSTNEEMRKHFKLWHK
jgi:hypothetical protein